MPNTPKDYFDACIKLIDSTTMTKDEKSQFIGNVAHESGHFKTLRENLNYKPQRLLDIFPNRNGLKTLAQAQAICAQGANGIANAIYGGDWGKRNLGNTEIGDGAKFIGTGLMQMTGRANFTKVGKALGMDLINKPEEASVPSVAAKIALFLWNDLGASTKCKAFDYLGARRRINGGTNGFEDTQKIAKQFLDNQYKIV